MPVFSENSAPVTQSSNNIIANASISQQIFGNQKRSYLLIQNLSDTDMKIGIGYEPNALLGFLLPANGGGYVAENGFIPSGAVFIWCTAAGKLFHAVQGG